MLTETARRFEGKVAFITGAARGASRAAAVSGLVLGAAAIRART